MTPETDSYAEDAAFSETAEPREVFSAYPEAAQTDSLEISQESIPLETDPAATDTGGDAKDWSEAKREEGFFYDGAHIRDGGTGDIWEHSHALLQDNLVRAEVQALFDSNEGGLVRLPDYEERVGDGVMLYVTHLIVGPGGSLSYTIESHFKKSNESATEFDGRSQSIELETSIAAWIESAPKTLLAKDSEKEDTAPTYAEQSDTEPRVVLVESESTAERARESHASEPQEDMLRRFLADEPLERIPPERRTRESDSISSPIKKHDARSGDDTSRQEAYPAAPSSHAAVRTALARRAHISGISMHMRKAA